MSDLAREITPVNIEEELKSSYLDYAMSVIVGRALPDVRDGLKPVHRRVLYAMNVLGNDWNKAYKNLPASSVTSSVNITRMVISPFMTPSFVWRSHSPCATCW